MQDYQKACELQPTEETFHRNRGNALQRLERYPEALAAYDEALRLKPGDPWGHNGRGLVFASWEDYSTALAEYDQALAHSPNLWIQCQRGFALIAMGRRDEALSIAQELTDAGTQRAAALEWRSRLLIGLREYTAAASCLEELLRDQAQAADALWLRAMIHVALGEDALADTICRELLGAHPAHADGWFLAAELSYARSDREQAYAALESGLARRPNDRHARLAMAWLAKEKGQDQQFAEIVSDIRQALPDHGESYTRALFAAITDDLTTARMWLDRATSFAPYLVDSKRLAIALTPLRLAEELIQQQTPS